MPGATKFAEVKDRAQPVQLGVVPQHKRAATKSPKNSFKNTGRAISLCLCFFEPATSVTESYLRNKSENIFEYLPIWIPAFAGMSVRDPSDRHSGEACPGLRSGSRNPGDLPSFFNEPHFAVSATLREIAFEQE